MQVSNLGRTEELDPANPGLNTALIDIFHIQCELWRDPNQHAITKYVFKVVEETARGNETRILYAGPLDNAKVGLFFFNDQTKWLCNF